MLPRETRLRRASEFAATYEAGRAWGDSLVVLHVLATPDRPGDRQVGFSVSKKVGNAVVRNRVKRRLREIVRGMLPRIAPGHRLVVRVRPPAATAPSAELARAMARVLGRAGLLREVDMAPGAP